MRQRSYHRRPIDTFQKPRVNEQIRAPEVLLVGETTAEKMTIAAALERAKAEEADLIEVSPKAVPPVVKIGDFGSYLYRLKKKDKQQKSHSKHTEVKVIRFGFRTDVGDLDRQANRTREFLAERHMVKVTIVLRGRELSNKEYGINKLKKFVESLADASEVDQPVKRQGNHFIVILRPKK
ncbi:MAG: translation initiation factor IF-3 [Candidatus Peribacteraceae bacterium]|nr:translation initiation factor IF-3 [Candidatus Peribacteraceae bacterium]